MTTAATAILEAGATISRGWLRHLPPLILIHWQAIAARTSLECAIDLAGVLYRHGRQHGRPGEWKTLQAWSLLDWWHRFDSDLGFRLEQLGRLTSLDCAVRLAEVLRGHCFRAPAGAAEE